MENISEEAYKYAKKNKRKIREQFIGDDLKGNDQPVFIFMAGAPGAGKTEFSKHLIDQLQEKKLKTGIVRIDADEIRKIFTPMGYNGKNSDLFKKGCVKGVDALYDSCLKNKYHTVLDGTFSSFGVAKRNIDSALNKNALVIIVYIYQNPLVAWGFAKIREQEEGRRVSKDMFIKSYIQSIKNVNTIKEQYGKQVAVWFVEKDIKNSVKNTEFDVINIDNHIKAKYTIKTLNEKLYEEK